MRKIVKLSFLADRLEEAMEGWSQFYNVETGEVESLPDQDNDYVDFKEFEEIAEKIDASYVYVRLPTQFDIHEYRIMEAFAEKEGIRGLFLALRGRGAFRRFKDCCADLGIRDEYFTFRHNAYFDIARQWCEENKIPFEI